MTTMKTTPFRRRRRRLVRTVGLLLFAWAAITALPAAVLASTAYGDLNNFDVFNDTGEPCHGFEIELEDIHSTDVTYTYDWNHYGAPTITEDNSDPAHPKVRVRYAAKYNGSFTAFTAMPASPPAATDGHQCTNPAVNIGCEHFGVGYYGNPTAVRYHWLVADPLIAGNLLQGPLVNIATPVWTYYPPAPGQPVAQVQAAIEPPKPPEVPVYEFGDAIWVKSIVTTSHNAGRVDLEDLVSDDPDNPADTNWQNGEPDEVEVEWSILQTEFSNPDGANNELAGGLEELPDGDEVITRRYEFYKYAGPLDEESNEATCDNYPQITDPNEPNYKADCDPASVEVLGDYIGAQMAGFNVEAVLGMIDHVEDGSIGSPMTPRTVVVGGNTPYIVVVSAGTLPAGLDLDPATGVLSGLPVQSGLFTFTVNATDADVVQASQEYTMHIAGVGGLCEGIVCTALDQCHEAGVCDSATGLCSNPSAADSAPCDDSDACTQSDSCQAGVCVGDNPVTCSALDQCHDAGVCDPATGTCLDPPSANGTPCDDSAPCTVSDVCIDGSCTGDLNHCGDGLVQFACGERCDAAGTGGGCNATCSVEPPSEKCLATIRDEGRKLAAKSLGYWDSCLSSVAAGSLVCSAGSCALAAGSGSLTAIDGSDCVTATDCCPDFDASTPAKTTGAKVSVAKDKGKRAIRKACSLNDGPDGDTGTDDDDFVSPATFGFPAICPDAEGECSHVATDALSLAGDNNDLVDCLSCSAESVTEQVLRLLPDDGPFTDSELKCRRAIRRNSRKLAEKQLRLGERCLDRIGNGSLGCEGGQCVVQPGTTQATVVSDSACAADTDCCPSYDAVDPLKGSGAKIAAAERKSIDAIWKSCSTGAGADGTKGTSDDTFVSPASLGSAGSCDNAPAGCTSIPTASMSVPGADNDLIDCLTCSARLATDFFGETTTPR